MKTPREIMLETHQAATPALDQLRATVIASEVGHLATAKMQTAQVVPRRNLATAIGLKLWNELIWPSRQIWGALAAVWVVLGIINFSSRTSFQTPASSSADRSPEIFTDWGERQQLLSELMQARLPRPVKPSAPVITAPDSSKSAGWIQSESTYLA